MHISAKKTARFVLIASVILIIGFVLSSGIAVEISDSFSAKVMDTIKARLYRHITNLEVDSKHCYLLPFGKYSIGLYVQPLSYSTLALFVFNSVFNILFQPVFLCPFTPQVFVNIVLLPFFLYGVVRYFKKVWFLVAIFIVLSFWIGIYDSGVEALIRHGMSCELIYVLIGTAGFASWITKNSY